jgi:peptidoglycan-N-acetylglucosamine deacetylase
MEDRPASMPGRRLRRRVPVTAALSAAALATILLVAPAAAARPLDVSGPPPGAEAAAAAAPAISVVSHGSHSHRWIALTFDDGWDATRCQEIEHTLLSYHVSATWFPNAIYVRNAPSTWRDIAQHFPIGNHTRSHPDLTTLTSTAMRHQIASDERIVEGVTGVPMVKLLRPPYGDYNSTVEHVAADLGYQDLVLWNVDDRDTQGATASQALADAEKGTNGSIVLMHCGPSITPGILPAVIEYYRSRGFRFVTVPHLLSHG